MNSASPKLTIVIPTRERCDTLEFTLKTCVTQDYDHLELIVSDNYSQDGTKDVVHSFKDSRLRYINPGKRLSMSANWEFALYHVSGDYVSYIGDDDGFLPGAVRRLASLLSELGSVEALAWGRAVYNWPSHVRPSQRNTLFLHTAHRFLHLHSDEWLRRLAAFKCVWASLPSLYNGFISLAVIERLKDKCGGRFFNSAIPDVYSAVAIASTVPHYYFSLRAYSVAGISHHSTGNSFSNQAHAPGPAQRFLAENDIPIHKKVVMSSLASICAAECLLQAHNLGLTPLDLDVDMRTLIKAALLEASEEPTEEHKQILTEIRQIGAKNGLEAFTEDAIAHATHSPRWESKPISAYDIRRRGIVIRGEDYGISDIYGATQLCERILSSSRFHYLFPLNTIRLAFRSYAPFIRKRWQRFLRHLAGKRLWQHHDLH